MNNKSINIILITLLVIISALSIYMQNYFILVANVCVIAGVIMDQQVATMLLKENANFKLARILKKLVPVLWLIGGLALVVWGWAKYLNND